MPDFRLEQRRGERGFPIAFVVIPIVIRIVLDGIVQIPNAATRGADEILHRAVFEECRLKRARTHIAAKLVRLARSARPDLSDVAVATIQHREAGLRADDAPLRVVKQAVSGHVGADVFAGAFVEFLDVIKHLLQCAAIEKVFQLACAPTSIHGTVGRLPFFVVVTAPLAFEAFRITAAIPELRLFQMDRFCASVERALHSDTEKFSIVHSGAHVIHVTAVTDLATVAIHLRLVLVIDAVEATIDIILILSPSHARHHMDAIAVVAPCRDACRQIRINAINDGDIRTQV